jgi:hypothetical protein
VDLDAELDRLYGLPLDEFVRERDETAKRLRRGGEREAADVLKAQRKPTAGAWALNQAIRRRRAERDALLAAGERLRAAHEALLSGGDAAALRDAMQEERRLAAVLADCSEAIASETGKSGPALKERVRASLHAATVDEEAREELETGRFVREREAVGLGPFGGAMPAPTPGRTRKAPSKSTAPARGKSEEEAAAQRDREERLAVAEQTLDEARAALRDAQAAHAAAEDELASAREAVREAELREREARKTLRGEEREVAKRERELERVRRG